MPEKIHEPVVVLLSGGLDSTVLLHHVVKDLGRSPVHALSFNYGQRHSRELDAARWQVEEIYSFLRRTGSRKRMFHRVIDISFLGPLVAQATTLVTGGGEVPDLAEVAVFDLVQPPTYVPFRNMILLSLAAALAESEKCGAIFHGAQAQDEYGYWDCTREFIDSVNRTMTLNRKHLITVEAPFAEMRKSHELAIGQRLGVDFSKTWSCYRGGRLACGTCPTCVERLKAFAEAGLDDPLVYGAGH